MDWHTVSSSSIERVAYDSSSMTLTVEFKHGGAYQYFDVPDQIYQELVNASSPGQYLAQNVKSAYRYSRM